MQTRQNLAIIIPAYNEDVVLGSSLESLLKVVDKEQVFVVNDRSADQTRQVAAQWLPRENILNLRKNRGKAGALNAGIKKFKLTERFEFIMPIDADTIVKKNFIPEVMMVFLADRKKEIACVVGKVQSVDDSWLTCYRMWEYEIAQSVYKQAQDALSAIVVCPGCATVYRSRVLAQQPIPEGTRTEDMALTYAIHRRKLGKVVYCSRAEVITQDPRTLSDFVKQIDRWYTGFWQCVSRYQVPWGGQSLDLEVGILAIEGLLNSLVVAVGILLWPWMILAHSQLFYLALSADLLLFMLPTLVWTAIRNKTWNVLGYLPQFYLVRILGGLVFLKGFLQVVAGVRFSINWDTARYQVNRKMLWFNPSV